MKILIFHRIMTEWMHHSYDGNFYNGLLPCPPERFAALGNLLKFLKYELISLFILC